MRTLLIATLLLTAAATAQEQTQFPAALVDPVLECTVHVKKEIQLPARDNGALIELVVEEGDVVEAGALLGRIDDTEAVMAHLVAQAQLESAVENAGRGSKIQLEYAQTAADVARVTYQRVLEVYNKGAVTDTEKEQSRLEWERAKAQIKVRELENTLAEFEVQAKDAELDASVTALARRQLTAPFAGVVAERYRREGEWVQAGEPILRLMNFETMVVSGYVNSRTYSRQNVDGKPVTVEFELAGGERFELPGQITYVSPVTDSLNTRIAVKAEVANQRVGRHWLLADGETVKMTIHVK
jgi:HlyD family secretion protein